MRLWSIHPEYLDTKGLVALWREGLLARKVLEGKTIGYKNHPQLLRFKKSKDPLSSIDVYLEVIVKEAERRRYDFDKTKIKLGLKVPKITVTSGQIEHEMKHLKSKLLIRDLQKHKSIEDAESNDSYTKVHPLFNVVEGAIEEWEKVAD